jgi:ribonuclease HI
MELMAAVNSFQSANQAAVNVEVYLDGDVVTGAITQKQVNDSLSGTFATTNRFAAQGAIAL